MWGTNSCYFIFNDIDSRNLGLIIPNTVFRPSWTELTDDVRIPGRPEIIKTPTGNYENQTLNINAIITDSSKINTIYAALHGEGRLILSTNVNEYINCRVLPLIPQGVALDMAEIPISFDCFPFAYALPPTTTEIGTQYTIVDNQSSIYSAPIIKLEINAGSGTIKKGDVNFDGKITAVDASLVLTEVANIAAGTPTFTPQQFAAGDMDDSGTLTSADATAILQIYTGEREAPPDVDVNTDVYIYTNGEQLLVGLPDEVTLNGFDVYIDCGLHLIYYVNMYGDKVNILHYSSLDLPLLHIGENYMKYQAQPTVVKKCTVIINERWL